MSVKELKLTDVLGTKINVKAVENNEIQIEFEPDDNSVWLDRNQAHLLKLWLEEHLG